MSKIHFQSAATDPQRLAAVKCGRQSEESTQYRSQVTCAKCLTAMDRDVPVLKARIDILSKRLAAQRRMRGVK